MQRLGADSSARALSPLTRLMWSAASASPPTAMRLRRETLVQAPLATAFAFFADAANLERLTPPWLQFAIKTPMPVVMRAGLEIEYRIRLYGVPIRWLTVIEAWEPGRRFVDRQIVGPYVWWRHEHRFEAVGDATRVIDEVEYLPRLAWITRSLVQRDVTRIFEYREATLQQFFQRSVNSMRQA